MEGMTYTSHLCVMIPTESWVWRPNPWGMYWSNTTQSIYTQSTPLLSTICSEKLRLLLFAIVVVPLKVIGSAFCLFSFYTGVKLAFLIPKSVRSDIVAFLGRVHCRACLFCLGFVRIKWVNVAAADVSYATKPQLPVEKGTVTDERRMCIVSNHCAWSDILVHMSRYFPAFVARDKTETTPVIGPIRWDYFYFFYYCLILLLLLLL